MTDDLHLTTRATVTARLRRFRIVSRQLDNGLNGARFIWNGAQAQACMPVVRAMGLTLATKTRINALGLTLKRGAKPVGSVYFGAPISRQADVYLVECQCVGVLTAREGGHEVR